MTARETGRLRPTAPFVTQERLFTYGMAVCAIYAFVLGWALWHRLWFIDAQARPLAVDFLNFWTAGLPVHAGDAPLLYDFVAYKAVQAAAIGHGFDGYFPWPYPPTLLLLVAPLCRLPFLWAWLIWVSATATFLMATMRLILPWRLAVPLVLAAPASLWCLSVGQNGFLTGGLMAAGLALRDRRPLAAGVFIGLLTYKPQFGLLFPLFLLIERRRRTIAGAALSSVATGLLSAAIFGPGVWRAFFASLSSSGAAALFSGEETLGKLQSVYAIVLRATGEGRVALATHLVFCVALLAPLARLWLRAASPDVRAAALVCGAFLCSPRSYIYDAAFLTVAIALLVRDGLSRGFRRGDRALLAAAWLTPGLFLALGGPTAPLACALILAVSFRRAGVKV